MGDSRQTNGERGMLGYTGTFNGRPVSVQSTGMGCPSAAIVVEELIQLGVKRLLRDRHVRRAPARPQARRPHRRPLRRPRRTRPPPHYVGGEPHAPTADWELVHGAVHAAKELGKPVRVGPIVSSDLFYNPDAGQYQRWSDARDPRGRDGGRGPLHGRRAARARRPAAS